MRLKGKGVPSVRNKDVRGDHYITLSVRTPNRLSEEAKEALRRFDELTGNSLQMDLSAFYMQVRDQQLSVMAGNYGFGRMMVNAGKSYSCGAELTLRGKAFDNRLSWTAAYGYTHAAFKEYDDAEVVDGKEVTISYKDKRVPFVPDHTLS